MEGNHVGLNEKQAKNFGEFVRHSVALKDVGLKQMTPTVFTIQLTGGQCEYRPHHNTWYYTRKRYTGNVQCFLDFVKKRLLP